MTLDPQVHRFIDSLETSLSVEETVALRNEDQRAVEENLRKYVELRAEKVEYIISQIPYLSRQSLKNFAEGSRIIKQALKKRKFIQILLASTPQGAIQYGARKEEIGRAFEDIIERYDYLYRVIIGTLNGRSGRNRNLLPVSKERLTK